jgi:hypothetical protein
MEAFIEQFRHLCIRASPNILFNKPDFFRGVVPKIFRHTLLQQQKRFTGFRNAVEYSYRVQYLISVGYNLCGDAAHGLRPPDFPLEIVSRKVFVVEPLKLLEQVIVKVYRFVLHAIPPSALIYIPGGTSGTARAFLRVGRPGSSFFRHPRHRHRSPLFGRSVRPALNKSHRQ